MHAHVTRAQAATSSSRHCTDTTHAGTPHHSPSPILSAHFGVLVPGQSQHRSECTEDTMQRWLRRRDSLRRDHPKRSHYASPFPFARCCFAPPLHCVELPRSSLPPPSPAAAAPVVLYPRRSTTCRRRPAARTTRFCRPLRLPVGHLRVRALVHVCCCVWFYADHPHKRVDQDLNA